MLFIEILTFFYLFLSSWFHIIILLIVIELFILKIYFFRLYFSIKNLITNFFVFLFIAVRVAEARVGISLLTILVRICGRDRILIINI
jgi:NADH:ubiquinone oxidoreductase subunit K